MMKTRIGLANLFRTWASNDLNRSALCLLLIGTGCATMSVSCSMNADKDRAAQTDAKAPTSSQNQPAAKAPPKEANPALTALTLQELSVREERGQTTLLVKFSQPVTQFRHFPLPQPSRIVLDIFGEAKALSQAETFRIETNWVAALRLSATDGSLRLVADIAAANVPPYTITPENGGLKITVGALDPNAVTKKDVTLVRGGQRIDVRAAEATSTGTVQKKTVTADDLLSTDKKYTGQKISLDFKDADIKNVFRLLAEVSGLNIIVTTDVNRKVTVRLVEVPWDQALDLIVDTNGLGKEQLGNVVRISTAGQLKSEKDALAAARRAKEDLEPLQTIYFNVNYAKVKDLESKVKSLLSKRPDAALVADERSNTIMVRDIRKVVDDVNTLVAKLDARTPQVLIESNLIETTPSFARSLGAELGLNWQSLQVQTSTPAGSPFSASPLAGGLFTIAQSRLGAIRNLSLKLSAAENEGKVKIISKPSVVTLNNIASTIKSERILRIALPSSTNIASGSGAAAGTAVATEKIPVGITLTVTPQVSSDGFVLMNINVKSSSIANNPTVSGGVAGVIPFDELNREATANVLVRDGETIVIGGILKDTAQDNTSGIPYLKDVPVLGWLFKSWSIQKDLEELVVFITPRIAEAGSENLPTADELWREQMKKTQGEQATAPSINP
ncbi:MAG: type IV pilus secretin PilQ [Deltaproteobacteria bacterium]|nr:MAG: type IV pilus secretin PilQ [Deltaproteobacteria bacterium]